MENFEVKVVDFEEKSIQEKEQELLEKFEQETGQTQVEEPDTATVEIETEQPDEVVENTFFHILKQSSIVRLIALMTCLLKSRLNRRFFLKT